MSQLSRPYQIALAVVLVLAIAWLLLVHGHHGQPSASGPAPEAAQTTAPSHSGASHASAPAHAAAGKPSGAAGRSHGGKGIAHMQSVVQGELARHKVVLILFWNPRSSVDRAVRHELEQAARKLGGSVVVHVAKAGEVGDYGTITSTVTVLSTPTILVVNPRGQISAIHGLTDVFSIDQQIHEARAPAKSSS